jgi:hypothetical protein
MVATVPQSERDPNKIVFALRQIADVFNRQPPVMIGGITTQINLNSANTDNLVTITPPGTRYKVDQVLVKNVGATASLTLATAGLFTATSASGTAIAAIQALNSVTASAVNSVHNLMTMTLSSNAEMYTDITSLYFRVSSAQGASSLADVYVYIRPLP